MRKSTLIIILLLSFSRVFAQEQQLKEIIKSYGIPGMQLVYAKGSETQAVNIGVISKGSDKKVTSNTIFEAASLSKSVFAYAVFRLYDRGVISLDTPLLHYIGEYVRFDAKDARYAKITARMVLRHTTGLPNWGDDQSAKLMFTPDSTFSYSGEGYLYLQKVIEQLVKKPLDDIMQQEVFEPIGMTNSSYTWSEKYDTVAAFGNKPNVVNRHKNQNAAYSLLTNAHDYTLFLQALIAGKGLKSETRKMMFEKSVSANWYHHRIKEADQYIDWGLGVGLQRNEKGNWIWHWGDNGDFKCFYIANPVTKESLVYFTYNTYGLHITTEVLNTFFGKQTWWINQWTGYQFNKLEEMNNFRVKLNQRGFDHAADIVNEEKKKDPAYQLSEEDVIELGFILMRGDKKKEAVEIFQLNLNLFPNSANAYEGLAEGYEATGKKELALKNFKKSYELNPKNDYAAERIKKLESENGDK